MPSPDYTEGSTGICTTPACVHIASEILVSLATNYEEIDPCTDFHECKLTLVLKGEGHF